MQNKIAVAMSGGVDSSVAAALCVDKYGKENVFGVTMKLFCYDKSETGEKSCCSLDSINDAKKVCEQLEIPHYVVDLEKEFNQAVINNFISVYKGGRTPNPCIRCNQIIKFDYLLQKAKQLGADKLATGHYARIKKIQNTKYQIPNKLQISNYKLLKGKDQNKDQSYFLYGIKKEDLENIVFPIGDITKTETRKLAKRLKLRTAEKKESQEICFVPGKTEEYLSERIKIKHGDIVDTKGNKIGVHKGIFGYTIGQRKGLGGGSPKPFYVVGIDKKENKVIVGEEKDLYKKELTVSKINWLLKISLPLQCTAKIRYRMKESECTLNENGRVIFKKPQRAITPGQSIVFYMGDTVLGGGTIIDSNNSTK